MFLNVCQLLAQLICIFNDFLLTLLLIVCRSRDGGEGPGVGLGVGESAG